jgi:hypothetical protein
VSLRSRFLDRVETSAIRSIEPALADGETVVVALSGLFGAVSGGKDETVGFTLAGLVDPFDVFLTTERLLAVRTSIGRRRDPPIALACDRKFAHVGDLRRAAVFDRVTFVFKDETLGLTAMRRNRGKVDVFVHALAPVGE